MLAVFLNLSLLKHLQIVLRTRIQNARTSQHHWRRPARIQRLNQNQQPPLKLPKLQRKTDPRGVQQVNPENLVADEMLDQSLKPLKSLMLKWPTTGVVITLLPLQLQLRTTQMLLLLMAPRQLPLEGKIWEWKKFRLAPLKLSCEVNQTDTRISELVDVNPLTPDDSIKPLTYSKKRTRSTFPIVYSKENNQIIAIKYYPTAQLLEVEDYGEFDGSSTQRSVSSIGPAVLCLRINSIVLIKIEHSIPKIKSSTTSNILSIRCLFSGDAVSNLSESNHQVSGSTICFMIYSNSRGVVLLLVSLPPLLITGFGQLVNCQTLSIDQKSTPFSYCDRAETILLQQKVVLLLVVLFGCHSGRARGLEDNNRFSG